jgi:hypothetical protein
MLCFCIPFLFHFSPEYLDSGFFDTISQDLFQLTFFVV